MNRHIALGVASAAVTIAVSAAAILTSPQLQAGRYLPPTPSFTQTPPQVTEEDSRWDCRKDGNRICGPQQVPAICAALDLDLQRDCTVTFHLTDRDIPGPSLVEECIDSYPLLTAKPELAICLDPR